MRFEECSAIAPFLINKHPYCDTIVLGKCSDEDAELCDQIVDNSYLTSIIVINRNNVAVSLCTKLLQNNPHVSHLSLMSLGLPFGPGSPRTTKMCSGLVENTTIRDLHIYPVFENDVVDLAEFIRKNRNLEKLTFYFHDASDDSQLLDC